MSTFRFLPSIRESQIITCRRCNRRQYPRHGNCLHCHSPLGVEFVDLEFSAPLDSHSEDQHKQLAHSVGTLLRSLRKRSGICQSELARKATGIGRSYLSKAECGRVLLRLDKLLTLLRVLGLTAVILRFERPAPRILNPGHRLKRGALYLEMFSAGTIESTHSHSRTSFLSGNRGSAQARRY
jgi:transcriptional regulator with XRE-family HTH domain